MYKALLTLIGLAFLLVPIQPKAFCTLMTFKVTDLCGACKALFACCRVCHIDQGGQSLSCQAAGTNQGQRTHPAAFVAASSTTQCLTLLGLHVAASLYGAIRNAHQYDNAVLLRHAQPWSQVLCKRSMIASSRWDESARWHLQHNIAADCACLRAAVALSA